MEYRKEINGQIITLWDDSNGIGLQFKEGETLQRYTHSVIITRNELTATEEGLTLISKVSNVLTEAAAQQYPKEFAPIND